MPRRPGDGRDARAPGVDGPHPNPLPRGEGDTGVLPGGEGDTGVLPGGEGDTGVLPGGEGAGVDWQERARAFARARLRLYGLQTILSLLFPVFFWYAGWSASLELSVASLPRILEIAAFVLAYQGVVSVLFLPFSYYGGFVLQHRFGLSRQTTAGWLSDWVKSTLIGTAFFLVGAVAFYLAVPAFPESWWWLLAIALTLVAVLLTYVAPVLLLPIFYRRKPLEEGDLSRRIKLLADRAGARVSQIYVIDMSRRTVAANAALAGIGSTRQVLLGDTMLQQFSPDEVETVVAHEFGHHVHGDIWKALAAEVAGIWVGLYLLQHLVRPAFLSAGMGDISTLANLPLLLFLGEVAALIAMPISNAVSRHYEAQADAFAARMSRMPEAYAAALHRLARQNLSEVWPPQWVELLFYTHPAIGRRMRAVNRRVKGEE